MGIIKSKETRVVAHSCRYSSGPLIPNSATATVLNIRINCNCPLEYLQVLPFFTYIMQYSSTVYRDHKG